MYIQTPKNTKNSTISDISSVIPAKVKVILHSHYVAPFTLCCTIEKLQVTTILVGFCSSIFLRLTFYTKLRAGTKWLHLVGSLGCSQRLWMRVTALEGNTEQLWGNQLMRKNNAPRIYIYIHIHNMYIHINIRCAYIYIMYVYSMCVYV